MYHGNVKQVFAQVECDASGAIHEAEWESAWHNFPELLDMMSLSGMSKIVLFATEIANTSRGAAAAQQQSSQEPPE